MPATRPHLHDHDSGEGLMPLDEARERILGRIEPLPPVEVPLREADGLVLAREARTHGDIPPFPSSAMDGFAVRSRDVAEATADRPVALRIAGGVNMGRPPEVEVGDRQAVSIPTGGPIPTGADCVVPIEACVVEDERVLVMQPSPAGRYVRPAGQDVPAGGILVPAGRRRLAPGLGRLAAAGIPSVSVRPAARVGIVSTGDELVSPEEPAGYGQVHDANAFTLHGAVREAGAAPVDLGTVPDDPARLVEALASRPGEVDALVSSGGVSVGERDPVKAAFRGRGEVEFLEVAMQPGKPQAFGSVDGRPYFGLPGNPVSVFVSFEVFVRPALMMMMGRHPDRPEITAELETDVTGPPGKTQLARVRVRRDGDRWVAASTGARQSNLLATVSRANGLAIVPAGTETLHAGQECRVILFRDPDEP